MVDALYLRYLEDLKENKIASEIHKALSNYGIEAVEVRSTYSPKFKMFAVTYSFSKNKIKLSAIEGILNDANLLEKN